MKWGKKITFALSTVAVVSLIALALRPRPVRVEPCAVTRGVFRVTVVATGKARARNRMVLSASVTGVLRPSGVRSGDRVTKGQLLATILPSFSPLLDTQTRTEREARLQSATATQEELRAAVDRARAEEKRSGIDFGRTEKLVSTGALGSVELEHAQFDRDRTVEKTRAAELAFARATREVAIAKAQLQTNDASASANANTRRAAPAELAESIVSPMDGVVLRLPEEFARPVTAGMPLIEVGDRGPTELLVDLPTAEAVPIHTGAPADIEHWGGPDVLKGVVRMREGSAFTKVSPLGVEEQRIKLLIDPAPGAAASAWSAIEDGYYVEAKITVSERPNVLKAPLGAIFRKDSGWAAYSIEKGKAVLRRIDVGEMSGTEVEIRSDLAEGARLVKYPSDQLREGMSVIAE